jgi:L-aminopeptidase/D-esterase-like protein
MRGLAGRTVLRFARPPQRAGRHTVIGVVATNAALTKEEANQVAMMAHDGIARCVRPAHTMLDGDTLFALSTGRRRVDVNVLGAFAAEMVAESIGRAIRMAETAGGVPALRDLG